MIKYRNSFISVAALIFVIATILTSCTSNSVKVVESGNEIEEVTESNETSVETLQADKISIGFENWHQSDEFDADVQAGILEVQDKFNVKTIVYDSSDVNSSENTRGMISGGIKGAIEYYRDPVLAKDSVSMLEESGVPVVSLNYPVPGSVYVGVNYYDAGFMAGEWMGNYAVEKWAGDIDLMVIIYYPLEGEFIGQLFQGIEKGLGSRIDVPEEKIVHVDGRGNADQTAQVVKTALDKHPEAKKILVGVGNDASAKGALAALKDAGRTGESVIVGQGMQEALRSMMMESDTPLKAGVAYFPEKYGDISMQVLLDLIAGKSVPEMVYVDAALITKENISDYYPQ
ncbi:MAG: sugar ABC transporter substrate-binding protein [Actinobacteria bacterium]|nr:sugar ABC transporter substrate-binding protein [Actinomycetota bacterium]